MIYLIRFKSSMHGTQGMLFLPNGWNCCTMEPPWLQNIKSRSCIPEGEYKVSIKESNKYGSVYQVRSVPKRTDILFHSGNFAGDEESGYRTDTDGCILLGTNHGILGEQEVVFDSVNTINAFMNLLDNKPFDLTIKGEPFLSEVSHA